MIGIIVIKPIITKVPKTFLDRMILRDDWSKYDIIKRNPKIDVLWCTHSKYDDRSLTSSSSDGIRTELGCGGICVLLEFIAFK